MSDMEEKAIEQKQKNQRTTIRLSLMVVGMFAFGFALVPLYQLICQVGGINGVASSSGRVLAVDAQQAEAIKVDKSRLITVQFDTTVNKGLAWDFYPLQKQVKVHPGERVLVNFYAKNNINQAITGQAVPSVTPWQVTEYFHKIECFCFTQQTLEANEEKKMPLWFTIDPKVEDEYKTVTLSYTFMNIDRSATKQLPETAAIKLTQSLKGKE